MCLRRGLVIVIVKSRDGRGTRFKYINVRVAATMVARLPQQVLLLLLILVQNVCRNAECIDIAEKIRRYMDPRISPCDDFYKFVCNKFHENKDKVPEQPMIPIITSLLAWFSSLQQNRPFQKAFKLYEICMAQNSADQYNIEAIRRIIHRIGGWPLVEGNTWQEKQWEDIVASLSQSGYYSGIFFRNKYSSLRNRPTIEMFEMDFAEIEQIDNVAWVPIWLGVSSSNYAEIKKTIQNVSDHFKNFKPPSGVDPRIFRIEGMMLRWPSIDWMKYFTSYFANLPDVTIDTNTEVSLYTDHVDNVVDFIARTSNEQIMNYVISQLAIELGSYLPGVVTTSYFGISLPEMVLSILRVNYIDKNIMDKISNIGGILRNKMSELINQAHLDYQTRQKHQETLSKMTLRIWGFDRGVEESVDLYKDLVLNEQDFSDTLWNVVKFHHNSRVERIYMIGMPQQPSLTNRKTLTDEFKRINGQYDRVSNKIIITLASLMSQSFQDRFPKYLNYGRFGNTIGHEIGHSVSTPEIWNIENNWFSWNQAWGYVRPSKVDCFKRKYDAYIGELNTMIWNDHRVTEDVADHIGVKLAHLVYKDWLEYNGPDPQLPNLNYTSMQMYWISYAHDFCDDLQELDALHKIKDHHSPSRYRVNMPLSNNLAFSQAFKCQPGSRMNPVEKCSYW